MKLAVFSVVVAVLLLIFTIRADSATTSSLRKEIRFYVRDVEQAKTTIRFFSNHAFLLYKKQTRRIAWAQVEEARKRIRYGRSRLVALRAAVPYSLASIPAIRWVFGPYALQAIRVADCETGGSFDTGAANGQYLGLFQMGSWERETFGHGPTAFEQARAAFRYFASTGFDWSPWSCKP